MRPDALVRSRAMLPGAHAPFDQRAVLGHEAPRLAVIQQLLKLAPTEKPFSFRMYEATSIALHIAIPPLAIMQ